MEREYYQKYYRLEVEHWWFRVRAALIRERISLSVTPAGNRRILNVGAATGGSTEWLQAFGKTISQESDPDTAAFLKQRFGSDVMGGSFESLPVEANSFDLLCAFDVLEHTDNDENCIQEAWRILKSGGDLVLTVPAYMFLWSSHDVVNHHKRRYTLGKLHEKLVLHNFEVRYSTYFNSLLFLPILFFRLFTRLFRRNEPDRSDFEYAASGSAGILSKVLGSIFGLEIPLLRCMRFPFGVSILVVARKLPRQEINS